MPDRTIVIMDADPSTLSPATDPVLPSDDGIRHPYLRPRDAAALLIVDRSRDAVRVLMGRRGARHVFLPHVYAFPGGRVDPGDGAMPAADGLAPDVVAKLMADMKGRASPRRARALALAAIRETAEETGLSIGAGRPALSTLRLIGRAITPPGRVRRYDTRFFAIGAEALGTNPAEPVSNGELEDFRWLSLEAARQIEVPRVTLAILAHLETRLAREDPLDPAGPVLYLRTARGRMVRDLL